MSTFTETRVEIADLHTTLHYLQKKRPAEAPLPFATEKKYCALHRQLAKPQRTEYGDVTSGSVAAAILNSFTPSYGDYKYWHRYLQTPVAEAFPEYAWKHLLPIEATITGRIAYVPVPGVSFRVSPVPRVILYPFGWSTWVSLRLLGDHNASDLAAFLQGLFTSSVFRYQSGP